jgi:hypothetical protein
MKRSSRSGWLIVLVAAIGIVSALALGIVGYWQYATSVPPFKPQLPPMPRPNGYERAAKAAERRSSAKHPPYPPRWPNGTQAELRAQLAPIRPILDEIREAFQLEWRAPPERALQPGAAFPDYACFRECARCFMAETTVARREGDCGTAMQRSLDGMELGAKIPWGGGLIARLVGLACHAMGFSQVERIVPHLPAGAIPGALDRVRRMRKAWPPLFETWESERIEALSFYTDIFVSMGRAPLREQLEGLRSVEDERGVWGAVRRGLVPRRMVLADIDRSYRELIAESKKPFRQRNAVPDADNPWLPSSGAGAEAQLGWKYEFAQTELAILEVTLAVRLHRLRNGQYPADLHAIGRQWLPAVPVDEWGQPVAYRLKGGKPSIYSLGPDGKDDGGLAANVRHLGATARGDLVFGKLNWSAWRK